MDDNTKDPSTLKEILRLREVVCDYFLGSNCYKSTEENMMRYFDKFVMLERSLETGVWTNSWTDYTTRPRFCRYYQGLIFPELFAADNKFIFLYDLTDYL